MRHHLHCGVLAAATLPHRRNRIALSHDRIRRVIRAPGGFVTEHDPETGELWLRPVASEEPEATDRAPVILFLGTEKGFTYGHLQGGFRPDHYGGVFCCR